MILIRRIVGDSMLPTMRHGQIVFAWRRGSVVVGDVVVLKHQGLEKIKRVSKVKDGQVFVLGDNSSQSTDSRSFGWIDLTNIAGRVFWPR